MRGKYDEKQNITDQNINCDRNLTTTTTIKDLNYEVSMSKRNSSIEIIK